MKGAAGLARAGRGRRALLIAAAVTSWCVSPSVAWAGDRVILSLGDDSFIPWSEVEGRTGAAVRRGMGTSSLSDFAVVVLSNVSYGALPGALRDGLRDYLAGGGSMLITGGSRSYGSGGYAGTDLAELLPLRPTRDDFGYHPYGPTYLVLPAHPILEGVTIPTMAYFNEVELNNGSIEIAQYTRTRRLPWPLIAERSSSAGTVLGVALDMALTGGWKDRDRFARNCVEYLLRRSRIPTPGGRIGPAPGG